jgi:hypothetical protein
MTEPRPRPQYGEYASPDEQVAAGGYIPPAEPVEPVAPASRPPARSASGRDSAPVAPAAAPNRNRDMVFTTALLALGAYFVVSSIPGLIDLPATLRSAYAASGYGEYTSDATADALGLAAVIVQGVLFVATVWIAMLRLRAKKLAFPVALIGGVVTVVVVLVLVIMAMVLDPALAAYVNSQV